MKHFVAVLALLLVTGCGSSSSSPAGYSSASPASTPVGKSAAALGVSGGHLVDAGGFSLYTTGASCTGGCLVVWPPLDAGTDPSATDGLSDANINLSSGQVSYKGNLLYYFESDTAPGDATGNGVGGFVLASP